MLEDLVDNPKPVSREDLESLQAYWLVATGRPRLGKDDITGERLGVLDSSIAIFSSCRAQLLLASDYFADIHNMSLTRTSRQALRTCKLPTDQRLHCNSTHVHLEPMANNVLSVRIRSTPITSQLPFKAITPYAPAFTALSQSQSRYIHPKSLLLFQLIPSQDCNLRHLYRPYVTSRVTPNSQSATTQSTHFPPSHNLPTADPLGSLGIEPDHWLYWLRSHLHLWSSVSGVAAHRMASRQCEYGRSFRGLAGGGEDVG